MPVHIESKINVESSQVTLFFHKIILILYFCCCEPLLAFAFITIIGTRLIGIVKDDETASLST